MTDIGSANLELADNKLKISCNTKIEIRIPLSDSKNFRLQDGEKTIDLKNFRSGSQIVIEVPEVHNGIINLK